jgi:hypothetical protein
MLQDIGIDQDGILEILVERGTPLPHEFSCQIQLNGHTELSIYEGNKVDNQKNKKLGSYSLENIKEGTFVFSLHISDQYTMKIIIDDHVVDTVTCTQVFDDSPIEEKRLWLNAQKEFVDYIQSTTLFLEDSMTKDIPEWKWVMDKLDWARQILDYEVSTEEYVVALREIEHLVNPVLQKLNQKIERSPLLV